MGICEPMRNGNIYDAIINISGNVQLMDNQRKFLPNYRQFMIWTWGEGSNLYVFDSHIDRLNCITCWEYWMPPSVLCILPS